MAVPNFLTDKDVTILRDMISGWKSERKDEGGRRSEKLWHEGIDQNTPDVYVALTPVTGIPALVTTGTSPGEGDTPGYADCPIYRISHNDPAIPAIQQLDISDKRVYNLTESVVAGQSWVLVHRTKTGEWIVSGSGGGGASSSSGCGCTCIENGDIVVGGVETTSTWTVQFTTPVTEVQTYGSISLPPGTYTLTYNSSTGNWELDIGNYLTAANNAGVDITSSTTMDGTLTFYKSSGGYTKLELCITGTVAQSAQSSGYAAGYTDGYYTGWYAGCNSVGGTLGTGTTQVGTLSTGTGTGTVAGTGTWDLSYSEGFQIGYDDGFVVGYVDCLPTGTGTSASPCGTITWQWSFIGFPTWTEVGNSCSGVCIGPTAGADGTIEGELRTLNCS